MARMLFAFLLLLAPFISSAQQAPYLLVLGTAQDGGYPHLGCTKECCNKAWRKPSTRRFVVSLALVDPAAKKWYLFEATPDFKEQLQYFRELTNGQYDLLPTGIFLTHAHIGHYTGLMQLGREVMNTKDVPVYVMPRMKEYLENNGPWSQLVKLGNVKLMALPTSPDVSLLFDGVSIGAFSVPHRDEYSETVGFRIFAGQKQILFIPDINKWDQWEHGTAIISDVKYADIALIDGTFYQDGELPNRKMSEVPHPFVSETMELFKNESPQTRSKIYFIHLNHTNSLLWDKQKRKEVENKGFHIASQGQKL